MADSNPTADWNPLGQVYYRKFEVYSMQWKDQVDLSRCRAVAAPFGGPIAIIRDEKKLQKLQGSAKMQIQIFNSAGAQIGAVKWDYAGRLVGMGWSAHEDLICVLDDGSVMLYDLHGQFKRVFSMGGESRTHRVIECKVFRSSSSSTGVAILTGNYHFYVVSDVSLENPRIRHLTQTPGLDAPPSSWLVLAEDRSVRVLVAVGNQLFSVDAVQAVAMNPPVNSPPSSWVSMAASFNYKFLALFGDNGILWVGTADLQNIYCECNTTSRDAPHDLVWCSSGAILAHWDQVLFMVGPEKDWVKYFIEGNVILVPEPDGLRIIDNYTHEFLQKVPDVVEKVFKIGSLAPGAVLYDAMREFERKSPKADEYVRSVKEQLTEAVDQCTFAAGAEYEPSRQRSLLRAAAFGKCFVASYQPAQFVLMCQHLRVLNAVRDYRVAMPLTYAQLESLTLPVLIDRLILRRQYCLAIRICDYLRLPAQQGSSRILAHWACYKVQQSGVDDSEIAAAIVQKLKDTPGISYTEIATKAKDYGRQELAIRLLDFEPRSADQVPLLMKMKRDELALSKAIESGDTDLVYTVVMHLRESRELADFLMFIRGYPEAMSLFAQYCRQQDRQMLIDLYYQDDCLVDGANIHLQDALKERKLDTQIEKLTRAQTMYMQGQNKFAAEVTSDHMKLVHMQHQLQDRTNKPFVGKPLSDTLYDCIVHDQAPMAEKLRKDFKVPDKRYWWLKLKALAETHQWLELDRFAKSKKSPIGYEPFFEACLENGSRIEAVKYIGKVPAENKARCYIKCKAWEQAAEAAFAVRNEEALDQILTRCGPGYSSLQERVQEMKMQLRQKY